MHMVLLIIGQFAFYTEPVKSTENRFHVYDPITGKERTYEKNEMTGFARSDFS